MKRSKLSTTATFNALQSVPAPQLAETGAKCGHCRILMRTVPSRKRVASYLQFSG